VSVYFLVKHTSSVRDSNKTLSSEIRVVIDNSLIEFPLLHSAEYSNKICRIARSFEISSFFKQLYESIYDWLQISIGSEYYQILCRVIFLSVVIKILRIKF